MNEDLMWLFAVVVVGIISFIGGCTAGGESMAELKRNGYEVVKHEVRHGNFSTNWVEVVKKGDKTK